MSSPKRLIDLDELNMPGMTMVKRQLEKWEKEHPITEIVVKETEEWDVVLRLVDGEWVILLKRREEKKC